MVSQKALVGLLVPALAMLLILLLTGFFQHRQVQASDRLANFIQLRAAIRQLRVHLLENHIDELRAGAPVDSSDLANQLTRVDSLALYDGAGGTRTRALLTEVRQQLSASGDQSLATIARFDALNNTLIKGIDHQDRLARDAALVASTADLHRERASWASLVIALLGAIGGWLILRSTLIGRLDRLHAQSLLLQSGHSARFEDEGCDELTQIFEALAKAAAEIQAREAQLKSFNDRLDEQIKTRTAELSDSIDRLRAENAARVKAQLELRAMADSLELRVKARTAELETANDDLESFSYSVSHDLRAPVRQINGFVSLLARQTESRSTAEDREFLDLIARSSRHMERLIDDLLAFSRSGRESLSPRRFQLGDAVRSAIQELNSEIGARNIIWEVQENMPEVEADEFLLVMVLRNLLSNAIKYTRPCENALIRVSSVLDPGGAVTLFVADNGVGFNPAEAGRLFKVFQRLHSESEFEGTGVGLAIVARIIERHGGTVKAELRDGGGAIFSFTLPHQRRGE